MNFDLVRRVLAEFEAERVEYVVFGAAAINLLGWARARPKDWGDAEALRRRFKLGEP